MPNNNNELFLTIYRNVYLRERIFKEIKIGWDINSKFQSNSSYKFHEITSCNWMVENNHIGLLYDKVKCGDYLVFNVISSASDYKQLFSFFNHENFRKSWVSNSIEFYSNLFIHYSNYFTLTKELIKSTIVIFIKYDLLIGVQVLFDNYININTINYEYSNKDKSCTGYNYLILKSISHCSLNILKFIQGKKMNDQININSSSSSMNEKFEIKIWKKIISYKYNGHRLYQLPINQYKILKFIINKMDIKVPCKPFPIIIENYESMDNKSFISNHILNIHLYNESISTLIYCSMIISLLSNYFQSYIELLSNKSYKLKKDFDEGVNEINEELVNEKPNEILSFPSIKQLKSKYKSNDYNSILVSDVNIEDKDIKYLFKMVLPFTTCFSVLLSNLAFYQIKYNFNYSCYSVTQSNFGISPISFGDYNEIFTFKTHTRKNGVKLFKFCKQDKKKQIQFINDAVDHLTSNLLSPHCILQSNSMTIYTLMTLLIQNDNLELIKLVVNKFINSFPNISKSSTNINDLIFQNSIFSIIGSIETFDYIITTIIKNNENQIAKSNVFNNILFELKDKMLLQHFQTYYPNEFHSKLEYLFNYMIGKSMTNKISFTFTKYAIENKICSSKNDFQTIWYSIKCTSFKVSEIIWLVENTPLDIGYSFVKFNEYDRFRQENIESALFWLFENRPQDFQLNKQFERTGTGLQTILTRCDYSKSIFYLYHYHNNTLGTILLDKTSFESKKFMDKSKFVLEEIVKRSDVKSLDLILSIYFNENKKLFYNFLNDAAIYGSFKIFKLLVDKYSHILHISPYSIISNYLPRSFFIPSKLIEYFDSNDRNPLGLVELGKFEKTLNFVLSNDHKELILYFKNIILTTKIQTFPIGLFTIYNRKPMGYEDYY